MTTMTSTPCLTAVLLLSIYSKQFANGEEPMANGTLSVFHPRPHMAAPISNDGEDRIVNGNISADNSRPYMAYIKYQNASFACVGTILDRQSILTAASCCTGFRSSTFVTVGRNDVNDVGSGAWRFVYKLKPHKDYNPETLENDICVIKLYSDGALPMGPTVRAVERSTERIVDNMECEVAGWGSINPDGTGVGFPTVLREAPVVGYTTDTCNTFNFTERVLQKTICAVNIGNGGNGCLRDGGAPLMCKPAETSTFVQYGLQSYVDLPCGTAAMFEDIFMHRRFIKRRMKRDNGVAMPSTLH